jgi:hypothetical protein
MHFLIALFFALVPSVETPLRSTDCAIDAKYVKTELSNNKDVRIELNPTGGQAPYYFFFFDDKNNPMSWDFKQNYYVGDKNQLPKKIKVVDSRGCFKWIELNESVDSNG